MTATIRTDNGSRPEGRRGSCDFLTHGNIGLSQKGYGREYYYLHTSTSTSTDTNIITNNHNDISGVLGTLNITNDSWTIDLLSASVSGTGPSVTENGDERTVTLPHLGNDLFYTMNLKQYVVDSGPTEVTQTISLNAGWNLISFYVDLNNASPATVFASLISSSNLLVVTKYNLSFTAYDPTKLDFLNSLSTMTNGFGYWVKTNTAVSDYYLQIN